MPTPKILKTKTLKTLLIAATIATAAVLPSASAAQVYFENASGPSGVVDVYVDGQLVFDNVFAGSPMMFPSEIASGIHKVVVTPNNLAPGEQDVLNTNVNFAGEGLYTLTLEQDQDTNGFDTIVLDLSQGANVQIE